MNARLDAIGLVTADMPRSLAFYRLLGLDIPAEADTAPHAEAALPGGLRLMWDVVATAQAIDPDWQTPTGGHRIALAVRCDTPPDVDALYQRLTEAGHHGHRAPWDAVWGQRYALVHDPDGATVELYADLPA